MFSGWVEEDGAYKVESLGLRGRSRRADRGQALPDGDVSGDQAHGAHGMDLRAGRAAGDRPREHPTCVFQVLKRHFARYTPRSSSGSAACRAQQFLAVAEALCAQLRPGAHVGVLLRGRLDAAHHRRADHPRRLDHPAAARQHRPPGRRHPGAARPREHPGLDGHPDALRHPAELHPDAAPGERGDLDQFVDKNGPRPARGAR